MSGDRSQQVRYQTLIAAAGRYMGYGLTWALSTALFLFLGRWLDGKLGTDPWLMILGAFVGGAAGFYSLYYHLVVEPGAGKEGSGEKGNEG